MIKPTLDISTDRVPPYSQEMEQALLACCLLDGGQESVTTCIESKITPESFYFPAHKLIYQTIRDLYDIGQACDELIVKDKLQSRGTLLEIGGMGYLNAITDRIDTVSNLQTYIHRVRDLELLRRLIHVSTNSIRDAYASSDDVRQLIESTEREVYAISEDRIATGARHISSSVENAAALIARMCENRGEVTGVPSGFLDLDRLTLGFQPGDMIVLAARPSMGKTALALNIADVASSPRLNKSGIGTLFFSLEMSADQLTTRLICSRARVGTRSLGGGFLTSEHTVALKEASLFLKNSPLWIDEASNLTILELRAKARRLARQSNIKFIVIDYLQLLSGIDSRIQREQQISEISRGVKALARELNVPVLVLSQLNRESEKEKRQPRLSDLRESGAIEQDADVVLLLARHSQMHEQNDDEEGEIPSETAGRGTSCVLRDLIVAKHRNGPVGVVTLNFNREYTRFENFTPRHD